MNYKNIKILVTGGAGFIGSHLVEKLVELEASVAVLDNLSTGNLDNLKDVIDKIEFINGDITNFDTCLSSTKNKEIIFHLAAFISVPESMQNPVKCNNININGTLNLLEAARINKVNKLIYSSSSAVYGNSNKICNEEDICNPTSVYGYSKLIGEILCKKYYQLFEMNTICLRYFNVFGARQNPFGEYAGVIAKFSDCMAKNQPITIFGDGQQTRDFIPVARVIEANLKLATIPTNFLNGQSINIATGKSITLLEVIEQLKSKFPHYQLVPIFKPGRLGDIQISQADCSKYNKIA